jgi:hypothetical protein
MKTITEIIYPAFALVALGCFALAPQARATCQQGCLTNNNTALGDDVLLNNTGSFNTAIGWQALLNNTGTGNTATGGAALAGNTTGKEDTAIGQAALLFNTTGNNNTAIGNNALYKNTTGSFNIALGNEAGGSLTRGNNNIEIGNKGVAGEANTIRLGKQGTQTATYIAGISGAIIPTGVAVIVDASGHLGTTTSSAHYKDEIKPMDKASEAILALKPVAFRYKKDLDADGIPQFGLVAEEVEKVNPDLVARDDEGKPYSVRYEAVNAMLLNEFLKEHKAFLQEQRKVEQLEKQLEKLTAGLQKVTAQIEAGKPVLQTIASNP